MTVRGRPTALGAALEEDLVAFRSFARGEDGDVLADDVQRARIILWYHDEWFGSHRDSSLTAGQFTRHWTGLPHQGNDDGPRIALARGTAGAAHRRHRGAGRRIAIAGATNGGRRR